MISRDIFTLNGQSATYENSFRCTPATVQVSPRLRRRGRRHRGVRPARPRHTLSLLIDRKPLSGALPSAIWDLNRADWSQTLSGSGNRRSPYLRTFDHEVDSVTGTAAFDSYDTSRAATPPGYRNRVLTVPAAFADAGLELRSAGTRNTVGTAGSGADLRWSTAELHAAMEAGFSQYRDNPQWKLWTLVATRYAETQFGFLTYGIMFDTNDTPRQGVAVFNEALQLNAALGTRVDLHAHVHELGHAFNLLHSWDKRSAWPPAPLGPRRGYGDLSWMNYPHDSSYRPRPTSPDSGWN
ncbi:hypothetical protein [Streptomyces sp. NPDC001889]